MREFAQQSEALGYDFVEAPDHVLGVNAASRPGWDRNTSKDLFHDPFVLFGYLAGVTQNLGFSTGVLILPQRQTVLVAKQAACLDVLCRRPVPARRRGRLERGRIHRPQREFPRPRPPLRGAGAGHADAVGRAACDVFKGRWHTIEDAGINPRPASGKVPVWFGGHHERTLERIAKCGDGWMPNAYPPDQTALDVFARLRRLTEAAGRDPAKVGIEVWVSMGTGSEADWAGKPASGSQAGASHLTLTTTFGRGATTAHPRPHDGRPPLGAAALSRRGRRPALGGR